MASVARAIEQAASVTLNESLWWESHEVFFQELDKIVPTRARQSTDDGAVESSLPVVEPLNLAQKLRAHHSWLLDTLLHFKPPSASSRSALNVARVVLGSHILDIKDDLKNFAMELSTQLVLDEVQAYILVSRFFGSDNFALTYPKEHIVQKIAMKYYLERQCVLKCTRIILLFQMAEESDVGTNVLIHEEVRQLVKDGLEDKIFAVLKQLLTVEHFPHLDPDLTTLRAEETVLEQTLVMDILFLLYYEPIVPCKADQWKKLFMMFQEGIFSGTMVEKLSITPDAEKCIQHIKHQAFLILIEALDLDKVLMMVFNEEPFSKAAHTFSLSELQQIDCMIAAVNLLEASEFSPLLFGWAIFICLVSSLSSADGQPCLLEIDHAVYMRQAYESGAYGTLLDMLLGEHFQESDALIGGYKSIVKTLLAAFLAAYDIGSQTELGVLDDMAEMFYAIYSGQETLCTEFWDRESVIDGPVRSLVFSLRDCFPYKFIPLVRLLTGLCEGPWAAECVYDFLYSTIGTTSLFELSTPTGAGHFVQTDVPLQVPGAPGLLIPAETKGCVLRMINNCVCLVHWECKHSGIIVLLVRMLDRLTNGYKSEEVHASLNLLYRLLSSNKMLVQLLLELDLSAVAIAARSDGRMVTSLRLDVLNTVSSIMNNLLDNFGDRRTIALCMNILTSFGLCCPGPVMCKLSTTSLFSSPDGSSDCINGVLLAESFLKMVLEPEQIGHGYILVVAVLDLCMVLVRRGVQTDGLNMMVTHIFSNLLVNHITWKYKQKYERWQITTKVLQLINVLFDSHYVLPELKAKVLEALLIDATIHEILFQILSVGIQELEGLYFNRSVHVKEIEWFEEALCASLTLVHWVFSNITAGQFSMEYSSMTQLEQALLLHSSGTSSIVAAIASLIGFSKNKALQLASVKGLSVLCLIAPRARPHPISISSYFSGVEQKNLRKMLQLILCEEIAFSNIDMFFGISDLLTVAARCQPGLIVLLFNPIENYDEVGVSSMQPQVIVQSSGSNGSTVKVSKKQEGVDAIWKILEHCKSLFESNPRFLSCILHFLSTLWQGGAEFLCILEAFSSHKDFWKFLTVCILTRVADDNIESNAALSSEENVKRSFQYQCQASALQIMAFDSFLHRLLVRVEDVDSKTKGSKLPSSFVVPCSQHLLLNCVEQSQFQLIMNSYARCVYDKEVLLRAKTEARALVVGLMVKVLAGIDTGLNASLVEKVKAAANVVMNHLSFQELLTYYSTLRYSHGNDLQILVLSDLYYHLRGELEGSRKIPAGSFQHLVYFLESMNLESVLHPLKNNHVNELCPPYVDGFIYDISTLKIDLGSEWWSLTDCKVLPTFVAESTLHSMQCANGMFSIGESQLNALDAWVMLLTLSIFDKQAESGPASLNSIWKEACLESCIQELCTALEVSEGQLGPLGDSTEYIPKFMAAQAQLLQILARWLSDRVASGFDTKFSLTCTKVVATTLGCLKAIFGSKKHVHESLVKSLLGGFLICLELMHFKNEGNDATIQSKLHDQNDGDAFVDVTLISMGFLPVLCSLAADKKFANLCIAAINIIVNGFLASPTWLPILQQHFPTRVTLSRLCMDSGTGFACQALNLFLSLACVKGGAEMLQSAGFSTHIMSFCNQIAEVDVSVAEELEGPFCDWQKREKQKKMHWSLCVAVVTTVVRSLGDKDDGGTVVENAFLFFGSEKERMLRALRPPNFVDAQGGKKARYQQPQTTISALQETQHVLLLMIELVYYQVQWSYALQCSGPEFTEMCIHLLAYIAREGLVRNISSNISPSIRCLPLMKEEIVAHKKPSNMGSSSGWFAVASRGCATTNRVTSQISPKSKALQVGSEQCPSPAVLGRTGQSAVGALVLAHTQYTDLVAINVYKIAFLLLTFICEQVQQALNRHDEGGSTVLIAFPELPAPEILYGLQDQVISVITEVCSSKLGNTLEWHALDVCHLLFGILEKALYLDVCVSRVCGIGPLSLRSEDFLKEYKALFSAVQGNQFLDAPLKSLKGILGLAYPGLF